MFILQKPPSLQWELTPNCNHDCIHCYNYWRKDYEKIDGISKTKSEAEYFEIAKRIVELQPVSVTLTGGEPLLAFAQIRKSIDLLQKNKIVVTINTNASLLNDDICNFLKSRDIHLFVSFPCAEPEICDIIVNKHGAFHKIVRGLDVAYSYDLDFSNNIVVSKKNIDYVEKTIDFLVDRYQCSFVSVTRVSRPINSDASFNDWMLDRDGIHRLLDIIVFVNKKYPKLTIGTACPYTPCSINSQDAFSLYGYQKMCTAGKTSFAIDVDGNYKACPRDNRLYGNIFEDSFATIYARMHEWRDGSFLPAECKKCTELSKCLGGCRTDSIPFTGKSDSLDCISDPDNLPIKYSIQPKRTVSKDTVVIYDPDKVVCVEHENMIRLSHGRNYVMVTPKFYEFLSNNGEGFTTERLAKAFNKSSDVAEKVIGRLLAEKIIHAM